MDTVKITVLPDGLIKMETDKISMPNHSNCEAFIRECVKLAGGKTTAVRKGKGHAHTHDHQHAHAGGEEDHTH